MPHDVSFSSTFNRIYNNGLDAYDGRSVESSRIIKDRASVTHPSRFTYVEQNGSPVRLYPGDNIAINFRSPNTAETFRILDIWAVSRGAPQQVVAPPNLRAAVRDMFDKSSASLMDQTTTDILPGDKFVLLSICEDRSGSGGGSASVLLQRFWAYSDDGKQARLFLELKITKTAYHAYKLSSTTKRELESIAGGAGNIDRPIEAAVPAPLRGVLKDGRKYIVYRFLLYSDDFNPHKSAYSQGSVGGVYIMPLGLPSEDKFSTSAVRCISLAPLGLSSNVVISAIMPDILKGATQGFPVKLPNGENVQLFLDFVSHVSDYPAATKLLDTLGHTANAPCTHCSFKKFGKNDHSQQTEGSRNANGTAVHSMNASATRTSARHASLVDVNLQQTKRHGSSIGVDLNDKIRCPFHYVEKKLWEARNRIPRTLDDRPVVSPFFCAYQSQAIGADHVLNGVIRNSLEACVWLLPKPQRIQIDARIRAGLKSNGLPEQHRIFKLKEKEDFALYSCSLSDCAAIFCIFAPIIETFYRPSLATSPLHIELYRMVCALSKLIGLTYFWPQKGVDSDADFDNVFGKNRKDYHATLLATAKEFLFRTNNASKLNLDVCKMIDKPNNHRVLELYIHTIPAFGHVRHVYLPPGNVRFRKKHPQTLRLSMIHSNSSMEKMLTYHQLYRIQQLFRL